MLQFKTGFWSDFYRLNPKEEESLIYFKLNFFKFLIQGQKADVSIFL